MSERLVHRNIDFGADPEFFIRELKTKKIITADRLLPSKNNKMKLTGGQAFFDGCQAEININPSGCREYVQDNIFYNLKELDKHINKDKKDYQFWVTAAVKMDKKSIMDADPECRRFGCDPSLNAYTAPRHINLNGRTHLYRYAGGHIHLGCGKLLDKENKELIKLMDRIVGIPATLLDTELPSIRRRMYYGQAGEYRIQPHGVEYRTLSNFWLRAPELASLMMGLARVAYTVFKDGRESIDAINRVATDDKVRAIINTTNIAEARKVFDKMRPYLTNISGPLCAPKGLQFFEYVSRNGINSFFNRNLFDDWKLGCKNSSHGDNARGWWRGMHYRLYKDAQFDRFSKLFDKKEGNKFEYYQDHITLNT